MTDKKNNLTVIVICVHCLSKQVDQCSLLFGRAFIQFRVDRVQKISKFAAIIPSIILTRDFIGGKQPKIVQNLREW